MFLEPLIGLIENEIEKIQDTSDDSKLRKAVLQRYLIIIKSIDMSNIEYTGKTIEEFEEEMSQFALVPIKKELMQYLIFTM